MSFGDSDFAYNVNINYPMDYLFGGSIAYISRIAAETASTNASIVVFEDTKAQLSLLQAAGLPLPSGRKKKRLVIFIFLIIGSFVISLILALFDKQRLNDFKYGSNVKYMFHK